MHENLKNYHRCGKRAQAAGVMKVRLGKDKDI